MHRVQAYLANSVNLMWNEAYRHSVSLISFVINALLRGQGQRATYCSQKLSKRLFCAEKMCQLCCMLSECRLEFMVNHLPPRAAPCSGMLVDWGSIFLFLTYFQPCILMAQRQAGSHLWFIWVLIWKRNPCNIAAIMASPAPTSYAVPYGRLCEWSCEGLSYNVFITQILYFKISTASKKYLDTPTEVVCSALLLSLPLDSDRCNFQVQVKHISTSYVTWITY